MHREESTSMKLMTKNLARAVDLAEELVITMRKCEASGVAPMDDPKVLDILHKMQATFPPEVAKLETRQQELRERIVDIVATWAINAGESVTDAHERIDDIMDKLTSATTPEDVKSISQNPELNSLLNEHAEISDRIVEIIANEED
jgi:mevalonate kinase